MATCFDPVLEKFKALEIPPGLASDMKNQIDTLQMELRFLKMFFLLCLRKCENEDNDMGSSSIMIEIEAVLKEAERGLDEAGLTSSSVPEGKDWEAMASDLLEKVQHCKPEIRKIVVVLLDRSLHFKSCNGDAFLELIDLMIHNGKDLLLTWEAEILVAVKIQIRALEKQLSFARDFVDFAAKHCTKKEKLEDFLAYMQDWVKHAACLSLLYWIEGKDENMVEKLKTMLSDLQGKIKPSSDKVSGMLVGILMASKSSRSDKILISSVVSSLVDFLLGDIMFQEKDCIQTLQEGLTFLMAFVLDPPEECAVEAGNALLSQTLPVLNDAVSLICSFSRYEKKEEISTQRKACISSCEDKINKIKAEIRKLYVQFPNSSSFNFPVTNGTGFIDYFLQNLEEMLKCNSGCISFAKHKVVMVQRELLSLRPFLENMMNVEDECEEMKDLWKRIIDLAYQADHAISSCSVIDTHIWYNLLHLSDVVEALELLNLEVKKANEQQKHSNRRLDGRLNSSHIIPIQANNSRLDDIVVGLEDVAEIIIDRLKRGSPSLDIVSIVGMPGQGKTTMAKKVYNNTSVKYHFGRCAWCCISQVYNVRELMLDILSDLNAVNARLTNSNTSDEDLADQIRRSLKRQRYLIVMDDIWDISAWNSLKLSFPDDENGSRIVFTSRIHDLVSQAKPNCNPHPLRALNNKESWELLEEKLFGKDGCPEELTEVGKKIAENCNGLPLAIVLVAGVLARTSKNLEWWIQVEGSLGSKISNEGCMDILELSYKHLPNCLRPCFLYFAAFPEDRAVGIQKLMKLWIAEGFIQRTKQMRLEDVAEEYLMDLIGRSLVIVSKRRSNGGIKEARVHDLVRDFCLAKVGEDKFLQWIHENDVSRDLTKSNQYYRLCIDGEWPHFISSSPTGPVANSLCLFGNYDMLQPHSNPSSFFNSFRLLKVLDLECLYLGGPFPEETTLIIHLRYLALWCRITYVPSSISNLWSLETFIVKSARLDVPLPDSFWTLKNLRHVAMDDINVVSFADFEQGELFRLDNVVTFSRPTLVYGRDSEELMRRLPGLRKLNCVFLKRQDDHLEPIIFPRLSYLINLESLKMLSFGMVFYGVNRDQFPAFNLPSSLRKLTLGRFSFPWSATSVIGQLPNLEILKLRRNSFDGPIWNVEDGEFLKLKHLELSLLNIQEWNVSDEAFSSLEQLFVRDCYSLQEIPSSLGYILTLQKMEIRHSFNAAASARQILEEQKEMGNDGLQVLIF